LIHRNMPKYSYEVILEACAMSRILHGLFVACVEDNDVGSAITEKKQSDKKVCFSMKNLFLFDPVQGRWLGGEPDPWVLPMATQIGPRRGPLSK
ncbi:MAG: hypothetical protein J7M12_02515, partial [Candidatus Hydrogenedentes bacterium]|nr:hypothetical protein [Candidatus Hydrogenedentota bacterium]